MPFLFDRWDSRFSGASGVATLTEGRESNILGLAVFLLTENEVPQDARYFRQESIEVRPLAHKGFCDCPTN